MSLILASGSPRRKELLALITPEYTVLPSDFDESTLTAPTPRELALALARGKCGAAAALRPGDTVLGCDTVVEFGGRVFGKPRDKEDARRMLTALSGADHWVHTGVCLRRGSGSCARPPARGCGFTPSRRRSWRRILTPTSPTTKRAATASRAARPCFAKRSRAVTTM